MFDYRFSFHFPSFALRSINRLQRFKTSRTALLGRFMLFSFVTIHAQPVNASKFHLTVTPFCLRFYRLAACLWSRSTFESSSMLFASRTLRDERSRLAGCHSARYEPVIDVDLSIANEPADSYKRQRVSVMVTPLLQCCGGN